MYSPASMKILLYKNAELQYWQSAASERWPVYAKIQAQLAVDESPALRLVAISMTRTLPAVLREALTDGTLSLIEGAALRFERLALCFERLALCIERLVLCFERLALCIERLALRINFERLQALSLGSRSSPCCRSCSWRAARQWTSLCRKLSRCHFLKCQLTALRLSPGERGRRRERA